MKTVRRILMLIAPVALSWTACDSGGVVPRDFGSSDTTVADVGSPGDPDVPAIPDEGLARDPAEGGPEDVDVPPPDTGPEVTVSPQPYIPAKSFRLEPAGREGDALIVHVIARDFGPVFGIALRVEWDPEVLTLAGATQDPVFGEEGTAAVYRAAEVRPGSLALAWAFLGSKKEAPFSGDVRLATLKLRVLRTASSPIAFFTPRCLVLTRRLEKVESVYLSAVVSP